MRRTVLVLAVLIGCTDPDPLVVPDTADSGDTGSDTDTGEDTHTDTAPPDPNDVDDDGDGYTENEGDCDDTSIWVNPGWDERPDDDRDNDCDGRIDEVFAGVVTVQYHEEGREPTELVTIDPLGQVKSRVRTSAAVLPQYMYENPDRTGWWAWDPVRMAMFEIKPDGTVTELVSLYDVEWPAPEEGGPFGLFGFGVHPDGFGLISGADRLIKLNPDGTWEDNWRTWLCLEADESHELAPTAFVVDPVTEQLGLLGYFGGFGVLDTEGNLTIEIADDLENPPQRAFSYGFSSEKGGFWAIGAQVNEAGDAVDSGIFRWNAETKKFVLRSEVPNASYPLANAVFEEETGDIYSVSNSAWYRTIWRVFTDGSRGSRLYTNVLSEPPDTNDEFRHFVGIGIVWDED